MEKVLLVSAGRWVTRSRDWVCGVREGGSEAWCWAGGLTDSVAAGEEPGATGACVAVAALPTQA